jgi:hypothetical protein
MKNNAFPANARTLPEATEPAPRDEYLRLMAEKIAAEARLEVATEQRKAEAAAKAEEPKLRASRAFAEAYHAWLAAKAETENPSVEDEEQAERFSLALPAAERRLMVTPQPFRINSGRSWRHSRPFWAMRS